MQPNLSSLSLPAIVTDIDGVLLRQKNPIPGSSEAIRFLKTPLQDIDSDKYAGISDCLPFVCLTNAGMGTESQKSKSLNSIMNLEGSHQIQEDQVIMAYTPLRPVMETYKDKTVLLVGMAVGNFTLEGVAQACGLTKFITDEELCTIYPRLVAYRPKATSEIVEETKKKIADRLGLANVEELEEPVQVHAIFIMTDPIRWDERIQIICDYLTGPNGCIAQKMPKVGPDAHIPVYCTNDDIVFAGKFRLPRIGFGCFSESLKRIYQLIYKKELQLNMYGKPCKNTYDYTINKISTLTDAKISNFYMIGDNPKSDIRGGNTAGWTTILVKTGVFQQTEVNLNDSEDPATHVVENFNEAIKLICELEGIKYDLIKTL